MYTILQEVSDLYAFLFVFSLLIIYIYIESEQLSTLTAVSAC